MPRRGADPPAGAPPGRHERERELKRVRNQRYYRRRNGHRTCVTIEVDEASLSAMVAAELLPEREAHLRESIRRGVQAVVDQFVADERQNRGF